VVRQAQQAGYTEPDPRDDLNGKDFARKMLILARETAADVEMEDIVAEQILPESCLNASDIDRFYLALQAEEAVFAAHRQTAESSGKVLRFIGTFEHGKISINLKMVGADHPFYNMNGSDNIKGPGAGAAVTAAGVFADILRVASFE
jgi:aspartokinase/homoserine dehydrogenase 1